jgi:hypothetical protein
VQAFFKDGTFSGRVEYSVDGSSWTTAQSINPTNGVWQTYALSFTARYVRLYQTGNFGWTLGELEVYGLLPTPTPMPTATPVATAPPYSTSHYVGPDWYTGKLPDYYKFGCQEAINEHGDGLHKAIVILDFGTPWIDTGLDQAGTFLPADGTKMTTADISQITRQFIRGYWQCGHPRGGIPFDIELTLAIGTVNIPTKNLSTQPSSQNLDAIHGEKWAILINELQKWSQRNACYRPPHCNVTNIKIVGALDIETWSGTIAAQYALDWANSYSNNTPRSYYNFGACDGCPYPDHPDWAYPTGWSAYDFWYLSWGLINARVIPEIYAGQIQAEQWAFINEWAVQNGYEKIHFAGALTQQQACSHTKSTDPNDPKDEALGVHKDLLDLCNPVNSPNSPSEGWQALFSNVQDPIFQPELLWLSDIDWDKHPALTPTPIPNP